MNRPTGELVVLIFAATLGLVLVALGVGLVALELTHPERDSGPALAALGNVVTVLAGASIGYLAGARRGGGPPDRT